MRAARRYAMDAALGAWIRENPDKAFTIMTPEGARTYRSTFTSHAAMEAERAKQEKLKTYFMIDELGIIPDDVFERLRK